MWGHRKFATMSFASTGFAFYYLTGCLEGGLFGIYSGLFAIYWHLAYHATKRETESSKPVIVFYPLCVLYVLTVVVFAIDIAPALGDNTLLYYRLAIASTVLFGCCDFIAQCILIHRCWIVYGQNIRVIIVPSILALAYFAMWVASTGAYFIVQDQANETVWGIRLALTSLITSMTVNALVTGLIVFRIFKVFRKVKSVTSSEDKSWGITDGNKLRSVTFIIIESGMALFAIQLARVVISATVTALESQVSATYYAFELIVSIHEMVNGIAPTIILVRVSLGLSFYDKESFDEAVGTSLQFAADDSNSIPEAGSIDDDDLNPQPVMGNINQERRDDEIGGTWK